MTVYLLLLSIMVLHINAQVVPPFNYIRVSSGVCSIPLWYAQCESIATERSMFFNWFTLTNEPSGCFESYNIDGELQIYYNYAGIYSNGPAITGLIEYTNGYNLVPLPVQTIGLCWPNPSTKSPTRSPTRSPTKSPTKEEEEEEEEDEEEEDQEEEDQEDEDQEDEEEEEEEGCTVAKMLDTYCLMSQTPCLVEMAARSGLSLTELEDFHKTGNINALAAQHPDMTPEEYKVNLLAFCACNYIYISCKHDCDLYTPELKNKCTDIYGCPNANETMLCEPSGAGTFYVSFLVFALPVFASLFGLGQE